MFYLVLGTIAVGVVTAVVSWGISLELAWRMI